MRHFIICFICIVLFTSAQAQFSFGPKAGLNITKISFSSANFKGSFIPAFYGGAFANYRFNAHWSGQFEAVYSQEGGKEQSTISTNSGHIHEVLLQFPLLAQYHTSMGWFAEAGPQLGLLQTIKEKYGTTPNTSIKQYYHATDFRVPFGIGYQFATASKLAGLGINARYSFSFSAINKEVVGGEALKNRVISIGAFYKIPVKKGYHKKINSDRK